MADHEDGHEKHESTAESLMDKITEKFHSQDSSSSSDSDDDNDFKSAAASAKSKIYRIFGREKPVHKVLGGGKPDKQHIASDFKCLSWMVTSPSRVQTMVCWNAVIMAGMAMAVPLFWYETGLAVSVKKNVRNAFFGEKTTMRRLEWMLFGRGGGSVLLLDVKTSPQAEFVDVLVGIPSVIASDPSA